MFVSADFPKLRQSGTINRLANLSVHPYYIVVIVVYWKFFNFKVFWILLLAFFIVVWGKPFYLWSLFIWLGRNKAYAFISLEPFFKWSYSTYSRLCSKTKSWHYFKFLWSKCSNKKMSQPAASILFFSTDG